jgi:hypothetical protein
MKKTSKILQQESFILSKGKKKQSIFELTHGLAFCHEAFDTEVRSVPVAILRFAVEFKTFVDLRKK